MSLNERYLTQPKEELQKESPSTNVEELIKNHHFLGLLIERLEFTLGHKIQIFLRPNQPILYYEETLKNIMRLCMQIKVSKYELQRIVKEIESCYKKSSKI